jgi:hypothetical protein
MATKKQQDRWDDDAAGCELRLIERLSRLSIEDDFGGGMNALDRYPELTSRDLSEFERDMRDWGFVYGPAFATAVSEWPDAPHPDLARLAFGAAQMVYVRWAGEIKDPGLRRQEAVRQVIRQFVRWDEDHYRAAANGEGVAMGSELKIGPLGAFRGGGVMAAIPDHPSARLVYLVP